MYTAFAITGLIITLIVTSTSVYLSKKGTTKPVKFLNTLGSFIDKYHLLFLFLIFAVFLMSRILKLDSLPNGIHIDEIAVQIDSKCILLNGTDRWGYRYPAYFYDYGNGQNALYTYVEAFLLMFLPPTIFTLRIQAVLWGALCFFAMYGICLEITSSKGYSLIGPILVTTLPIFIMSERWALEAYLFLPTATITMYFLIRAVKYQKIRDWVLSGIFMGTSLYTYAISHMVWPIFLVLAGIYLIYLRKIHIKQLICFGIPLGILAFPLIIFQLVNFHIIEPLFLWKSDYIPLLEQRGEELSLSNALHNISYFKDLFLGDYKLTYNAFPEFGTIYLFLIPFVIIGLVICIKDMIASIKEKQFSILALIFFFWIGGTVFMLVVKSPNVNRLNMLFLPFTVFIFIAIYRIFCGKAVALSSLAVWTGVSFVFFMYFYFFLQNSVYGYHLLFSDTTGAKALFKTEKDYLTDENTHIYLQFEDHVEEKNAQVYYYAAKPGDVFDFDRNNYGNVTAALPEEFDKNENAVYIIGNDWGHIISYLISEGWAADQSFPGYSILVRPN